MSQIILTCILFIFWIVLTQSIDWIDLVMGLMVSIISMLLSKRFLYTDIFRPGFFHIRKFFKYISVLIPEILRSGFKSLYIIATFKTDAKIIKVKTELENNFHIYILAVSITLTPGTITIYRTKNILYVLRLFPQSVDETMEPESIKAPFEKILMGD
jgi:multicomponent Na+:H+ antiporter subunit E